MKKFLAILAVSLLSISAAHAAEFTDVDSNEDGVISMDEATAAMPDLTDDAFAAADTDGDGSLNAEEFAAMSN